LQHRPMNPNAGPTELGIRTVRLTSSEKSDGLPDQPGRPNAGSFTQLRPKSEKI